MTKPLPPSAREPNPLGLAGQYPLVVAVTGRVVLPHEVRIAMGLEPGDLLSMVRNPVSLRLDSYRAFLADDWDAVPPPNRWRYVEEFLRRPLTALEPDGALELLQEEPPLLSLNAGDQVMLEVVHRGLSHELFLYQVVC
jgi:bifunctional DNA-binding transcriptional regulator/antitoxin component of YhaV-PrlF toxin-antitoxin module